MYTEAVDADVIVIGAGAAGLAAARRLAERSLKVIVIEARDRFGGRAWSRRIAHAAVPAEVGAEFIHGGAAHTMALLREAGTATIDTGGESWTLADGELRLNDDDFMAAASIFSGVSLLDEDESVDRFLQRFEGDRAMRPKVQAARAFAEGFDAVDPSLASTRSIAGERHSGVDSMTQRPLGGYQPMFDYLRSMCDDAGVHFYLSTRVLRISWRRRDVSVAVRANDADARTLHARAAIVTLPVGVLRHGGDESQIVFDPELPAAKREALHYLEMGSVVKVVLSFRTAFWEQVRNGLYHDAGFFRPANHPFAVYWTQMPVRTRLIVAWAGGPKATALGGLSQHDLILHALSGFASLFGQPALAREHFDGAVVHDWNGDPFSRGAYSYVAVGGGDARASLATPIDDALFFAGEATAADGEGGTVNGALKTGERAAREAATSLEAAAG